MCVIRQNVFPLKLTYVLYRKLGEKLLYREIYILNRGSKGILCTIPNRYLRHLSEYFFYISLTIVISKYFLKMSSRVSESKDFQRLNKFLHKIYGPWGIGDG